MTKKLSIILLAVALGGCMHTATSGILDSNQGQSQVALRSIQTKAYDTTDKRTTLRTVIATLQDLGFVVDKADKSLGTVTATKYARSKAFKMTVSVRPRNTEQLVVRANAQYGIRPVNDPIPYQDFFNSLSKAMFLEAHDVA